MRKLGPHRTGAKVIALTQPVKPRLECGIIGDGEGVYIETTGRFRMTAAQAESHAADVMQFVHELRNGGSMG